MHACSLTCTYIQAFIYEKNGILRDIHDVLHDYSMHLSVISTFFRRIFLHKKAAKQRPDSNHEPLNHKSEALPRGYSILHMGEDI